MKADYVFCFIIGCLVGVVVYHMVFCRLVGWAIRQENEKDMERIKAEIIRLTGIIESINKNQA